ncbi:MAG TPA: transposase zinc-binding domain-containing protein, partial [Stellaceae bacterium]|nr:transposase zinc-binding domain-containing protein [Stellaceae bacterium]
DIFHRHGAAWRKANAGHVSLGQLKAMSAIEQCRSAALGGHVERCEDCGHSRIAYNSCLMGKFRNGESTGGRAADPADFQMIAANFSALCSP